MKIVFLILFVCILAALSIAVSSCTLPESQKRLRAAMHIMSGETTEFEKLTDK
jgi:hypothetical protein